MGGQIHPSSPPPKQRWYRIALCRRRLRRQRGTAKSTPPRSRPLLSSRHVGFSHFRWRPLSSPLASRAEPEAAGRQRAPPCGRLRIDDEFLRVAGRLSPPSPFFLQRRPCATAGVSGGGVASFSSVECGDGRLWRGGLSPPSPFSNALLECGPHLKLRKNRWLILASRS